LASLWSFSGSESVERKWPWREVLGFGVAMADDEDNASSGQDADTFIETESPEVIIMRAMSDTQNLV
jgi:hypothetical protein